MATKPKPAAPRRLRRSPAYKALAPLPSAGILRAAVSVVLTVGALAGVFWAAEQHWVNFPFHTQASELVLHKSNELAQQLDRDNERKLQQFAAVIQQIQRESKIQTAQNQVVFLMRQEMSMKEGMAKLVALGRVPSPEFKTKLAEVVAERAEAEAQLKHLMIDK
jgi:hypothetical protein